MYIRNEKRFNIYASAMIDGVFYANFLDPEVRASVGITEIIDPAPPEGHNPNTWVREEIDDAPYVIWRPMSEGELSIMREKLWEQIKAIRDHKTQEGGFPASGKWFHSDSFSRTQHLGMVIAGQQLPAIPWKTMDGTYITTTPQLAQEVFFSAMTQDSSLFAHGDALKAQVDAAEDPLSIDLNAGWPTTFNNI